jgi:hypothetical protein
MRFWREDYGGKPEKNWHGEVESIQTGQKWQFNNLEELFRFLQTHVGHDDDD